MNPTAVMISPRGPSLSCQTGHSAQRGRFSSRWSVTKKYGDEPSEAELNCLCQKRASDCDHRAFLSGSGVCGFAAPSNSCCRRNVKMKKQNKNTFDTESPGGWNDGGSGRWPTARLPVVEACATCQPSAGSKVLGREGTSTLRRVLIVRLHQPDQRKKLKIRKAKKKKNLKKEN